jgi:ABC-type lipoprotein release transport system permease subunit
MRTIAALRIVVPMAAGSLFKTRSRTVVVGCLLAFGAMLTVAGSALLDSINATMTRAVTGSMAGHLQVYSAKAKDPLKLYGGGFMGSQDIGTLPSFKVVQDALQGLDNIAAIVPMGLKFANVLAPNETDIAIEELRRVAGQEGRAREMAVTKVRQLVTLIRDERQKGLEITRDKDKTARQVADAEKALSSGFWEGFQADPEPALTFLDASIAPLDRSGDVFYLHLLGTDVDQFREVFDRFVITDGEMVPQGQSGLLISKYMYEMWSKNKLARSFDHLHEELHDKGNTIAGSAELRTLVKQMAAQTGHVTFTLTPEDAAALEPELAALLPEVKGGLNELLAGFLSVDDKSFDQRYEFFYSHVAPRIRLYRYQVGDTLTLTTFTSSGYVKSRNVKLWGAYSFEGMQKAEVAGVYALIDLPAFRDLFGYMDEARVKELADIRAAVGVAEVERDRAEDQLFGAGSAVEGKAPEPGQRDEADQAAEEPEGEVAAAPGPAFDEFAGEDLKAAREKALALPVTREAIENGFFQNAAIVLKDPSRLEETRAAIQAVSDQRGLGLQVMDWETAAGVVGQFVIVVRIVLYISIFIIFLVALVIINNSLVMTTMERAGEIGTMRALGAPAGFVLWLFLAETLLLGAASGALGAGAAWGLVAWLGQAGIPADGEALTFLFGGPRLFPFILPGHVVRGLAIILAVSAAAACFPAVVAARVRPAVAMRAKE